MSYAFTEWNVAGTTVIIIGSALLNDAYLNAEAISPSESS